MQAEKASHILPSPAMAGLGKTGPSITSSKSSSLIAGERDLSP